MSAYGASDGEARRRALVDEVRREGFAIAGCVELGLDPADAARDPWGWAERLMGRRPRMVERQPIRAVPGGRSFASTSGACPLHTDSQMLGGAPPHVQIMVCLRQASRGGESLLLDAWALSRRVLEVDPRLGERLFDEPRRVPFVFGDVFGPTIGLRGGDLAFTHAPLPAAAGPGAGAGDDIGRAIAQWAARSTPTRVTVPTGSVLVVDNRRMLHGREAFDDPGRAFTRLLAWLPQPLGADPELHARAERSARRCDAVLSRQAQGARAAFGLAPALDARADARLALVVDLLRGVPPGVLAQRYAMPEADLYALRDFAIEAATGALVDAPVRLAAQADAARCALDELRRRR